MPDVIEVAQDDVLRGLKKFKRLAKQDLLASPLTSDPGFWSTQARARRATYDVLSTWVEEQGVDAAYRKALEQYAALPLLRSMDGTNDATGTNRRDDAEIAGQQQALELFFTLLGVQLPQDHLHRRNDPALPGEGPSNAVNAGA
ncbi:MAG TPA: hypothetical protein VF234_03060 [Limnochordia bacterium]